MSSDSNEATPEDNVGVPARSPADIPLDPHVFWRRVGAFAIDVGIMGLVGSVAGFFLFAWFAQLGSKGHLIGFAVAWLYFSVLNSRIGGGQTIGKRVAKIKVVDRAGDPVSFGRSCVRYVVLGIPFFLNGVMTTPSLAAYVAGFLVFGGGGAIIYLFLFNRRTRQSLHDLVSGTFVVRNAPAGAVGPVAVWRWHLGIVIGWFVIALGCGVLAPRVADTWKFPELLALRNRVLMIDGCGDAGVFVGRNWSSTNGTRHEAQFLALTVQMRHKPADFEVVARNAAAIALATYPDSRRQDLVSVQVRYGYDIGIAQAWIYRRFTLQPAEWDQKIAEAKFHATTPAPAP